VEKTYPLSYHLTFNHRTTRLKKFGPAFEDGDNLLAPQLFELCALGKGIAEK
jgi:hypothetical protein